MTNPTARLADIAEKYIGVQESPRGSNCGPMVDKFKAATDLNPKENWPWCAAFVSFCCQELQKEEQRFRLAPHEASVAALWNWADDNALRFSPVSSVYQPQRGDIVIYTFSHTGILSKPMNHAYRVIEGNTNDDGAREGYEVATRDRQATVIRGFIRLVMTPEKAATLTE